LNNKRDRGLDVNHHNSASNEVMNLPKGIQKNISLPNTALGELWDSIILNEQTKNQLISQAVLNFTVRQKISRSILPLHGVILLVGPPGTGKTSLARGLADRTATVFKESKFRLLEVEPHSLTSSAMGKHSEQCQIYLHNQFQRLLL